MSGLPWVNAMFEVCDVDADMEGPLTLLLGSKPNQSHLKATDETDENKKTGRWPD